MRRAVGVLCGLCCLLGLTACPASVVPPRATVMVHDGAEAKHYAILATPTTCPTCNIQGVAEQAQGASTRNEGSVDALLRLKLELAGYTIVDAGSLRLTSGERTDVETTNELTGESSSSTSVDDGPTVATRSPPEMMAAARSLGLAASLSSELLSLEWEFALVVTLARTSDGRPLWTVRCTHGRDDPSMSSDVVNELANCVGDGVLALRAPDAILTRRR